METSEIILVVFLSIINLILLFSFIINHFNKKNKISKLKCEYDKDKEDYNDEDLEDEIEPGQLHAWVFAIVMCLDIWIIGAYATHWWAAKYFTHVAAEDNNKALFGDSFGAVNALISAFAFAGMIVAFILKRYELKLQRKELKAQRKEFEQQNSTLALQRFENTFFNMMELQQQIVNDLSISDYDKVWTQELADTGMNGHEEIVNTSYTGRQFISYVFHHTESDIKTRKIQHLGLSVELARGGLKSYENSSYRSLLDHYFRHLYTILKFINESQDIPTFKDKYRYATFLRSTLSRYELVLLYYNGLSSVGNEKLKPLIEKYCMLKNLDQNLLILSYDSFELTKAGNTLAAITYLKDNNLSGGDFEVLLTDQNLNNKYHYTAFYNTKEGAEKALEIIARVNDILK